MSAWLVACGDPDPGGGPGAESLEVVGFQLAPHVGGPLALDASWELSEPVTATLRCTAIDGESETLVSEVEAASATSVVVRGLRPSTTYSCQVEAGGDVRSDPLELRSEDLPEDLPRPELVAAPEDPRVVGYTLVSLCRSPDADTYIPFLLLLDPLGAVRWYSTEEGCGSLDTTWLGDGRLLLGGEEPDAALPRIMDFDRQELWTAPTDTQWPDELAGAYNHDVGISADGTSVYALVRERGEDGVSGFIIKQIDLATNAVLWSWSSALDGVEQGVLNYDTAGSPDVDPWHANALWDTVEDGKRYVFLGLRNLDALMKIDQDTRQVVWTLGPHGDFTLRDTSGDLLSPEHWFFGQHDAKLWGTDTVLAYDNGVGRPSPEPYSRVVELQLDQDSMEAVLTMEWAGEGWFQSGLGGLDRLDDGGYAIARPLPAIDEGTATDFIQLDPTGLVRWKVQFPFETGLTGYRSETIPPCAAFGNSAFCAEVDGD